MKPFINEKEDYHIALRGVQAKVLCNFGSLLERHVMITGYWEPEESQFINRCLKPGMTAIDIGANVGLHSVRMAALVGMSGRVFSLEPNPSFSERLKRNAELNGFRNISIAGCGLSDQPGVSVLYVNGPANPNKNATLVWDPQNADTVACTVSLKRLDDVWHELMRDAKIDFLKLDIEGYELSALRSGRQMLEACRPVILSEFSHYYARLLEYSWQDVQQFYSRFGYRLCLPSGKPLKVRMTDHSNFNFTALP